MTADNETRGVEKRADRPRLLILVFGIFLIASLLAAASTSMGGMIFSTASALEKREKVDGESEPLDLGVVGETQVVETGKPTTGSGSSDGSIGAPPGASSPPPRSAAYGPDYSHQCWGDPLCKLAKKYEWTREGRRLACEVGVGLTCSIGCSFLANKHCDAPYGVDTSHCKHYLREAYDCNAHCKEIGLPICGEKPKPPVGTPPVPVPSEPDSPICPSPEEHSLSACQNLAPPNRVSDPVALVVEGGDEEGNQVEQTEEQEDTEEKEVEDTEEREVEDTEEGLDE